MFATWSGIMVCRPSKSSGRFHYVCVLLTVLKLILVSKHVGLVAAAANPSSSLPSLKTITLSCPRGGGKRNDKNVVESSALTVIDESKNKRDSKNGGVSAGLDSLKNSRRAVQRKTALAFFLLRLGYLLLLPISLLLTAFTLVASIFVLALRIITLNLTNRDSFALAVIAVKACLSLVMASLTGVPSPLFATFGLVASLSGCAVEATEPLLRMRYRREIKRLRHLHRLMTDPVLLETLGSLTRGAKALAVASTDRSGKALTSASTTATELVEQLVASSGAEQFLSEKVSLPPPVRAWGADQYQSLRNSGLLEDAAARAVEALKRELGSVTDFLPYLDAIENVRRKQIEESKKNRKK